MARQSPVRSGEDLRAGHALRTGAIKEAAPVERTAGADFIWSHHRGERMKPRDEALQGEDGEALEMGDGLLSSTVAKLEQRATVTIRSNAFSFYLSRPADLVRRAVHHDRRGGDHHAESQVATWVSSGGDDSLDPAICCSQLGARSAREAIHCLTP